MGNPFFKDKWAANWELGISAVPMNTSSAIWLHGLMSLSACATTMLLVAALTEAFLHRSELSAFCFQKPHPLWNFREIWYLTETLNGSASQQEDIMLYIRRESWYRRKGRYIVSLIFEWQKSIVSKSMIYEVLYFILVLVKRSPCYWFLFCVHVITAKHHKTKVRAISCLRHEEEMKNKMKWINICMRDGICIAQFVLC